MSKCTPGPWDRDGIYYLLRFGRKSYGPWDDEIEEGNWMPDEDDADLIAAAPELLAALEELVNTDSTMRDWDAARDVIAKAKGEGK